jgi:hypothetical protein
MGLLEQVCFYAGETRPKKRCSSSLAKTREENVKKIRCKESYETDILERDLMPVKRRSMYGGVLMLVKETYYQCKVSY